VYTVIPPFLTEVISIIRACVEDETLDGAKQLYSASRLAGELLEHNIKTIVTDLPRQGLLAKAARKFSPVSYRHDLLVSEKLLKQDFYASAPTHKWESNMTYLCTSKC